MGEAALSDIKFCLKAVTLEKRDTGPRIVLGVRADTPEPREGDVRARDALIRLWKARAPAQFPVLPAPSSAGRP